MDKNEISVQFKPTAEDCRRVLIWYQWKRIALIMGITLAIIFSLVFFLTNTKVNDPKNDKRPVIYATLIFMPFFILGSIYWGIWRQAKKMENIAENTKFTFEQEALEALSASSTVTVRWERFNKIVETSQDIIFFPQENVFYPIPKRHFEGEHQLTAIRSLLAEKLGDKVKLKN